MESNMAKFIVLVIDSFGVGEMQDVAQTRPQDIGSNTCANLLKANPRLHLPNLERLGLINALGFSVNHLKANNLANYGTADLQHDGGDTFMGHQEILGTKPKIPLRIPFSDVIEPVEEALLTAGYQVERRYADLSNQGNDNQSTLSYLWVNGCVAVGDNLEADLGQVFNITANLSVIDFSEVVKIGRIVRNQVKVDRVIAFGGLIGDSSRIHQAVEVKQDRYIGINAPKSGAYDDGFQVIHLGYGVDASEQVPAKLAAKNIDTTLIGKVADIVENPHGTNFQNLVDSTHIMQLTLEAVEKPGSQFICTNIQETDLAGHAQSVERYSKTLEIVDEYLGKLLPKLTAEDCLVVMADHGNDPTIGHSKHTRERVPLLVYRKGLTGVKLGHRETLSDVGATVCEFFDAEQPANGTSFFTKI